MAERSGIACVRDISLGLFRRSPHTGCQPKTAQTNEKPVNDADRARKRWKPQCKPDREQHTGPSRRATILPDRKRKIDDADGEEE
jgi:hypothetical protein